MNTYIIKEYGIDDNGHEYLTAHLDNDNEVYEGNSGEHYEDVYTVTTNTPIRVYTH